MGSTLIVEYRSAYEAQINLFVRERYREYCDISKNHVTYDLLSFKKNKTQREDRRQTFSLLGSQTAELFNAKY